MEKFYLIETNSNDTEWKVIKEFNSEQEVNKYINTHYPEDAYIIDEYNYNRLVNNTISLAKLIEEICE